MRKILKINYLVQAAKAACYLNEVQRFYAQRSNNSWL